MTRSPPILGRARPPQQRRCCGDALRTDAAGAVGGWLGGAIFDATVSYRPAFQAALAFDLVNLMLLGALYLMQRRPGFSRA